MFIVENDRPGFDLTWEYCAKTFRRSTPFYSQLSKEYDKKYDPLLVDNSFMIYDKRGPFALVPNYQGQINQGPIFRDEFDQEKMDEVFQKASKMGITIRYDGLQNAEIVSEHYGVVRRPYLIITSPDWRDVRKSYRPLISRCEKKYRVKIITCANFDFEEMESYRYLHTKCAGRQTRSLDTFRIMAQMIVRGEAYLVNIWDGWDIMGSYLFYDFGGVRYYASSATSPSAEDGVGHLGVWTGISQNTTAVGMGFVEKDFNTKIRNIEFFKKGFGAKEVLCDEGYCK